MRRKKLRSKLTPGSPRSLMSPGICGRRASVRLVKSLFNLEVIVNKFLKSLLKTGVYFLEQSDRVTTDMRDRVKDRVEDLTDRAGQAFHGQQNHTVRNAICFAAGIGLGVGIGVLFAPTSGEETRSSISDKVQDMSDRVRERFSPPEKRPATGTEGK